MKVSPLIAPHQGLYAETSTGLSWVSRHSCVANVWTVFYLDGERIEHRRRMGPTHGMGCIHRMSLPLATDEQLEAEAMRRATATNNRWIAYVVNRYRRGRKLVTSREMELWRRYVYRNQGRAPAGEVDLVAGMESRHERLLGPVEWAIRAARESRQEIRRVEGE